MVSSKKEKEVKKSEILSKVSMFFGDNLNMLDVSLPLISEPKEPKTAFECTDILNKCIEKYAAKLEERARSEDFVKMCSFVFDMLNKKGKKVFQSKVDIDGLEGNYFWVDSFLNKIEFDSTDIELDVSAFALKILKLIEVTRKIYANDDRVQEFFKNNTNSMIITIIQMVIILSLRTYQNNSFKLALQGFTYLLSLEMLLVNDLYNSDELIELIAKKYSTRIGSLAKPLVRKYYKIALDEAERLWSARDERTHGKMAEYLCDKYREEMEDEFAKELEKEFPDWKTSKEKKEEFYKVYDKRLPYYRMSVSNLTKKLIPLAIDKGRYHNPSGAGDFDV